MILLLRKTLSLTKHISEEIETAGIDKIQVRSPLTCETRGGICGTCYGRDLARGTPVNMGEAVGVMAAQSIGEPGTQLTMRTFHIGGAAQRGVEQNSVEASSEGKIEIRNENIVKNSSGEVIVMGRNSEIAVLDAKDKEKAVYRIPYGSRLLVKDGQKIKPGEKMADWDPFTIPVITEKDGVAHYFDLVEGVSISEKTDEATGIASKVVIDWRAQPKGQDLKPRISLLDKKDKVINLPSGLPANYYLSAQAVLSVENGQEVKAGDVIARVPRETSKTRDITGGLPRVAELFEARRPKDAAIIAEVDGYIEFGKDYKTKRRIILNPSDKSREPVEYMVPKGRHLAVAEGDFIRKGESIIDGAIVPHDILDVMGVEALADYIVNEIQDVYRLQGVKINDKHIEVIARQMMQKVEIQEVGDTTYLIGETIDKEEFEAENQKYIDAGKRPAEAKPILQGITKASLQTRSFISAASFQETTRVLTEAATQGKQDVLTGLKENVIVGRLIPAGTGSIVKGIKRVANNRDKLAISAQQEAEDAITAEREAQAAAAAAEAEADSADTSDDTKEAANG